MFSLTTHDDSSASVPKFEYPSLPDFSLRDKLMLEKESSGMYFSGHMIDSYSDHVSSLGVTGIADLLGDTELKEKQSVRICGIISSVNAKITKKNEKMAFIKLEDRYGEIEAIVFPKVYSENYHAVRIDAPVFIDGTVSLKEDEPPRVVANSIELLVDNTAFMRRKAIADECVVKLKEEAPTHTPKQYKKLYLRVSDFSCREYLKAKNIVDIFDGNVKVIFYNRSTSSYSEYHGRISATTYIISELSELLGEEIVVLK